MQSLVQKREEREQKRAEEARKLLKMESKLGGKKVVNSFVVAVAKAKARRRVSMRV